MATERGANNACARGEGGEFRCPDVIARVYAATRGVTMRVMARGCADEAMRVGREWGLSKPQADAGGAGQFSQLFHRYDRTLIEAFEHAMAVAGPRAQLQSRRSRAIVTSRHGGWR